MDLFFIHSHLGSKYVVQNNKHKIPTYKKNGAQNSARTVHRQSQFVCAEVNSDGYA